MFYIVITTIAVGIAPVRVQLPTPYPTLRACAHAITETEVYRHTPETNVEMIFTCIHIEEQGA